MSNQVRFILLDLIHLPESLEYIRKGTIKATVVQEPYEMGYRAVKMMIDLIEGKTVPPIVHTNTRIMRIGDLPVSQLGRMGETY